MSLERMLSIPAKKSVPVELYRPFRRLVATKYSESHAQKLEGVLETLNKCRMDMVEREDLSLLMQRDCLIHYFKCLCMVEPLFANISADTDHIIFVWYDAFNSEHVSSQHNSVKLEKAAVLFNLGAIYSRIGASCDPTTALGRHFAMDAFNAAANFFLKLWKVFAKEVSATLDLTLLFAESLHHIFSAQASELRLQQQLGYNDRDTSSAFQQYDSVYKLYLRAHDLIRSDSAAIKHVDYFDQTMVTHLSHKARFFYGEALRRQSPELELPGLVQSITLDDDTESVTEKLLRGICCLTSLLPSCRLDHDADSFREIIFSSASKPGAKDLKSHTLTSSSLNTALSRS
ncbi:hypothetical protein PIB30_045897 [Stylosanthes scabra]|uniref:BRO1 domain-containing protein n=1 Tax=Stylosanthes scabra TaxID=79078 RepID=A0ABU6UEY9_9FABA|nr:hypothetical protein [Stylosanthes scabra]